MDATNDYQRREAVVSGAVGSAGPKDQINAGRQW